jgi:hypothetical protein
MRVNILGILISGLGCVGVSSAQASPYNVATDFTYTDAGAMEAAYQGILEVSGQLPVETNIDSPAQLPRLSTSVAPDPPCQFRG